MEWYDMKITISKKLNDDVKAGWDAGYNVYELATINGVSASIIKQIVDDYNIVISDV
jgi:hypothetical protein